MSPASLLAHVWGDVHDGMRGYGLEGCGRAGSEAQQPAGWDRIVVRIQVQAAMRTSRVRRMPRLEYHGYASSASVRVRVSCAPRNTLKNVSASASASEHRYATCEHDTGENVHAPDSRSTRRGTTHRAWWGFRGWAKSIRCDTRMGWQGCRRRGTGTVFLRSSATRELDQDSIAATTKCSTETGATKIPQGMGYYSVWDSTAVGKSSLNAWDSLGNLFIVLDIFFTTKNEVSSLQQWLMGLILVQMSLIKVHHSTE
ncbi:hypothetical protein B0H17DRAFT_1135379 [Mycena rosella]|uniref:Uncharacterized protein n=1 Tax=Mycena rosella TaxID=1033263 RepID=A0AAD7DDB7_MYCRO|nr:hypothetical protein B0H17DRAFT_1135379 [Mycena rosella]